ncbi:MAG: prepilin-type N-terminal cleavage/methylation domain-containing protein [Syntrophorhabdaceae bacterium]|nr:prepilin-type N-terminal cleavage/methylation domain-containing protein [Syntrophorhabdaceae bacterium]
MPRRPPGFTLLELMISIVLITIIVVLLAASMRIGYRSLERGEEKAESMERYRVSLRLVDSQLQSGLPLTVKEDGLNRSLFIGKGDSMTIASNHSLFGGRRGYVIASYRIEADVNGKRTLFVRETTIGLDNGRETKLLEGFDEIRFEYYEVDDLKRQGEWVADWSDETRFPGKVRLHLGQGKTRFSLIIPVHVKKAALGRYRTGAA